MYRFSRRNGTLFVEYKYIHIYTFDDTWENEIYRFNRRNGTLFVESVYTYLHFGVAVAVGDRFILQQHLRI